MAFKLICWYILLVFFSGGIIIMNYGLWNLANSILKLHSCISLHKTLSNEPVDYLWIIVMVLYVGEQVI